MISEWPLQTQLNRVHITFQNELGFGGYFQVNGKTFHHRNRFSADKTGEHHFIDAARKRGCGRVGRRRVRSNRDGYRHTLTLLTIFLKVVRTIFMDVPMHACGAPVENLQPIHADVPSPRFEAASNHQRQRNERAAILRPAFQDGQLRKVNLLADSHHFLARRFSHPLWAGNGALPSPGEASAGRPLKTWAAPSERSGARGRPKHPDRAPQEPCRFVVHFRKHWSEPEMAIRPRVRTAKPFHPPRLLEAKSVI